MKEFAAITPHQEHWSEKPTDRVSSGQQLYQMLKTSLRGVLDVSSSASKLMFQPIT